MLLRTCTTSSYVAARVHIKNKASSATPRQNIATSGSGTLNPSEPDVARGGAPAPHDAMRALRPVPDTTKLQTRQHL